MTWQTLVIDALLLGSLSLVTTMAVRLVRKGDW